ncbi:SAM-dependent methyltransferase [Actinomadura verrucosospora]|uniref:S-adenosyl-l-methionine-dependent methyltransferase n=1 Tax=Actinomadura verrucosospora TaxID=46165 RepID=A0A7D4AC91_ACTVE|nr:SAM-dependent methyltransferase [Actinomadura verrucosospora]QKG26947.1 s-adenosyl-l-methionine-dependent methyltransferase [Actinomadura verrucosospora]
MSGPEQAPAGVDTTVPSVARMYDYYLMGKDNYQVDRDAAEKVIAASRESGTDIRVAARDNRGFLGRAVQALAEAGVRQFIDVGAGLPTQENVHQVALRCAPDSRVVYVDNDPMVLVHARALLAADRAATVVDGDLRDPRSVLEHPGVVSRIDFDEPVAVVFCAVLQFVPDDAEAAAIVGAFRDRCSAGSHLVVSHPFPGERPGEAFQEIGEVYTTTSSGSFTLRGRAAVRNLLAGTELLDPGLVPVQSWRGDVPADFTVPSYLGGVGRIG